MKAFVTRGVFHYARCLIFYFSDIPLLQADLLAGRVSLAPFLDASDVGSAWGSVPTLLAATLLARQPSRCPGYLDDSVSLKFIEYTERGVEMCPHAGAVTHSYF
jgi:hypothetical protein